MTLPEMLPFVLIGMVGVFVSSVAQVLLKKEALKPHGTTLQEYANPLVIGGYILMLLSTFMLVIALKGIPLSMAPILEATSYVYITVFGIVIFKEKLNRQKILALVVIVAGICLYSLGV